MRTIPLIALLFTLLMSLSLSAQDLTLESGVSQNRLLELFTSEGCSSCPPAERFLNNFKQDSRLWKSIIPLAFHVDYWDYIGWKDRFAQASFGQRQRHYARLQHRATVFTPAFFINGVNWRPGFFSSRLPEAALRNVGTLTATFSRGKVLARFVPQQSQQVSYILNITLLGTGISSQIKAGENSGRSSRHEFVVLDHQQHLSNNLSWQVAWSPLDQRVRSLSASDYAVALWVNAANNPTPVQATGSYLPDDFFKPTRQP